MSSRYKSVWSSYVCEDSNHFSSHAELRGLFDEISMDGKAVHSGIPVSVDINSRTALIDSSDSHTICYGGSGSKKTRCFVEPSIYFLAQSGESMVISDVKGEISGNARIQHILKANDYHVIHLDFRSFTGDGLNLLEEPCKCYCSGNKQDATRMTCEIVSSLLAKYNNTRLDPFWNNMGVLDIVGVCELLYKITENNPKFMRYVNLKTVAGFANSEGGDIINRFRELFDHSESYAMLLDNVFSSPERTLGSILSTVTEILKDFMIQDGLSRMTSRTTFDINDFYRRKTCLFLILPDECSCYDEIGGIMIDSIYAALVRSYTENYQNKATPRHRVNFILDEFCNLKVNDAAAKLSASRSRYIRWTLICQSKGQLEDIYPKDFNTILSNCKNILFLQSTDTATLDYISGLCGSVRTRSGRVPLVYPEQLSLLKQDWSYRECLFIKGNVKAVVVLPDIDQYISGSEGRVIPRTDRLGSEPAACIRPVKLLEMIADGTLRSPFATKRSNRR